MVEFTVKQKSRTCTNCKHKIKPDIIEYENVFNIKTFIKEEFSEWNLSPTAIQHFYEMIQTVVLLQADRCVTKAEANGEKTIMARNFDWYIMDEFKEWLEYRNKIRNV